MSSAYNLRKRTNPISYADDAGQQLKLTDLKKVVVHPAGSSSVCFTAESVLESKAVLENPLSTTQQVLQALRQLSCLLVSKADLEATLVAHSVRPHRKSANEEVQRVASNLIEKWKQVVLMEKPAAQQQQRERQQRLPGADPQRLPGADAQQQPIVLT